MISASACDLSLPSTKTPTLKWAEQVLRAWMLAGYPFLIGNAAEKVHIAMQVQEGSQPYVEKYWS